MLRGNWGIAKDKASIHASMEKVQSYEEAFAKIQAATGISDIDELVRATPRPSRLVPRRLVPRRRPSMVLRRAPRQSSPR